MLKIKKVSKSFHEQVILNDLSLDVAKGSIVGLVGPSGSGKSTLLRCIQALETTDAGSIECGGSTGFIHQDFQLFPHMTVLENITYAPEQVLKKTPLQAQEVAMKLLAELGLEHKKDAKPSALSGGQKQRVAIARALAMQPDVLLCDEPTSGLDAASSAEVALLLKKVHQKGVTMLIVSHDHNFLSNIAHEIVAVQDGKLVANG